MSLEEAALDEAWSRAWRGTFVAGSLEPFLAAQVGRARAWERACEALAPLHRGDAKPPPAPAIADVAVEDPLARSIAILGLAARARVALLGFDAPGLDEALEAMRALRPHAALARAGAWFEVTEHLRAPADARPDLLDALARRVTEQRFDELAIEASGLRVALGLYAGETDDALARARRLVHAARAEAIRPMELWASALLARARRYGGRPHLAARIADAVRAAAAPAWLPWIAWELELAGGSVGAADGPAHDCAEAIGALVDGDLDGFARARDELARSVGGSPIHEPEALALMAALDRSEPPDVIRAWAIGAQDRLPFGLDGAVSGRATPPTAPTGHAWVLAEPDSPARRILHPSLGVLGDIPRFERTARLHGRTETAASVLALAGPTGLTLEDFVRRVYGFGYARQSHDGMLRVLIHRMRNGLRSVASVDVEAEHIALRTSATFLVPDPRTATPNEDRVLRTVAAQRGISAKEVASALDMPLRTVQAVLGALVDEGACLLSRVGGGVGYAVEDTTFSDTTTSSA
ncbi:MAG: hypothetical protein AB7S26_31085 [Sandaracinaceae bacterium]